MELMGDYNITVPKYAVATSSAEARTKASEVFGGEWLHDVSAANAPHSHLPNGWLVVGVTYR